MKNIEYTEKQKIAIEDADKFKEALKHFSRNILNPIPTLTKVIDDILKDEYGVEREKYLTLREHLEKYSSGAHIHFKFVIGNGINVDVIDVKDFERYYNTRILDMYYVVSYSSKTLSLYEIEQELVIDLKED